MPHADLDTCNPEVQDEIRKIMGFYLPLGVSGFRMDAMPFVIQTKGALRDAARVPRVLQWRSGEAIILAEATSSPT
ncbi:MAG TPA: alpha-amylase family glycosyl hydrolase [Kofleriaceae bacterium]|nr:alpha-amylase family glycosyl hydrolase [Kofleriaceae bacterium]